MAGTTGPRQHARPAACRAGAVVLTSRAWGHEGGNDITAEFRNPGVPNSPLTVSVSGNDIVVSLATDAAGALSSTAAQVVAAINAHPAASPLVVATSSRARPIRGNRPGTGIVQPRAKVNLSDFLTTATNAHVQRGPFEYSVMRIGKQRDGSKVGVFLYCQQHAREWATPLTCLETAEQLLRNYAIDKQTRKLVDNLDIFILPSSNPDGAHYSMHNFAQQRKNMTNHCVVGGKETDDPFAANFWTPRVNPATGLPYTNTDPASRNAWGVDLNRNNTVGTIFDGYIGASTSCTSEVYAGPGEASEPEIKNELWIADTFDEHQVLEQHPQLRRLLHVGAGRVPAGSRRGRRVHANIGVEKYFFEAGDQILNRIKEHAEHGDPPGADRPDRGRPLLGGRQQRRRALVQPRRHRVQLRDGRRPFFVEHVAVGAAAARARPASGSPNRTGLRLKPGDTIKIDAGDRERGDRGRSPRWRVRTRRARSRTSLSPSRSRCAHAGGAVVAGGDAPDGRRLPARLRDRGQARGARVRGRQLRPARVGARVRAGRQAARRWTMTGPTASSTPITTTFEFVNEPSVIRYTTDGSTPDRVVAAVGLHRAA